MRLEHSTDIAAPVEAVWRLTLDVERWPELMPTVSSVERLDPDPFTVGSRARLVQPLLRPTIWTVVQHEEPRRFAWSARLFGVPVLAVHELAPVPTGCRNTLALELQGASGRLLGAVAKRRLLDTLATENGCFQRAAEAQHTA